MRPFGIYRINDAKLITSPVPSGLTARKRACQAYFRVVPL